MSSSSLKDILRKAIFEQFRKVPSGSTSILITDTRSERLLLDSKCTFEEFQGFGIREVTTLITRRAAFPTWNAVYFLTPTPEAVQRIIEDFDRRNRLYETAYVFFTTPLPDYLFEDFQNSGVLEFIRELIEMEIDFIPMEARVFMVDYEEATQELFGFATDSEVDVLIGGIAKKLRSALATLNEQPYIRYHSPDGSMESLSARLATSLHKEMLDLKKFDPNFPKPTPYDFNGPATLLIVDRSIDLISPLLHTLSYQSLVHDLFEVEEEDINGMKRLVVEVDTQKGIKKALVDGIDELYNSIRHLFFIDAFDSVKQSVREFIKATSLAAKLSGSAGVETLKNAIINLPEMLKKKDQLDALISFNAQLNNAVMVDRSLNELCELEQVLCVGETPDGDDPDPKALWVAFEELMENDDVLLDDKIRLLLLYTLTVDGLDDEDRQSLAEGASITIEDLAAVDGLRHFGVTPGEKRDVKKPDSPFTIQARKLALEVSRGTGGRRRKQRVQHFELSGPRVSGRRRQQRGGG
ncbi:Sec1-like protein [Zopfochytrium polystomum]|nr:Sec1-like protein [Zopfochytrium polystomum]